MKRYFYVTIHFCPNYVNTELTPYIDDLFMDKKTGEIYKKRNLYCFGWGQESGFELMPPLSFEQLIKLVECPRPKFSILKYRKRVSLLSIWKGNYYGAASVIMEDHLPEFVDFLAEKVNSDYFSDPTIRKNYLCFIFDREKAREKGWGYCGFVHGEAFEDLLNKIPKWKTISEHIIRQVYCEDAKP